MKRIQAPEGVAALMWELWEKHQRGGTPDRGNVFFVDLPHSLMKNVRNLIQWILCMLI